MKKFVLVKPIQLLTHAGLYLQDARQALLQEYYRKISQLEQIKEELSQYSSSDPHVYEQKRRDTELMKESALKWTGEAFPFSTLTRILTSHSSI